MKIVKKAKSEVALDLEKMAKSSPGLKQLLAKHGDLEVGSYLKSEIELEKREELVRVQLDLPQSRIETLTVLMSDLGISTRKDLFNNALTLLAWARDEKKKGNLIISLNEETDSQKELVMLPLENVAASRRGRGNNTPPSSPTGMGGNDDEDDFEDEIG